MGPYCDAVPEAPPRILAKVFNEQLVCAPTEPDEEALVVSGFTRNPASCTSAVEPPALR